MSKHDERIERFNNIKRSKNQGEWEKCVDIRESDAYRGTDVDLALDIMEIFDKCSNEINEAISHAKASGAGMEITKSIIRSFYNTSNISDYIE